MTLFPEIAHLPRGYGFLKLQTDNSLIRVFLQKLLRHETYAKIVLNHRKYLVGGRGFDIRREITVILPEPLGIRLVGFRLLSE